MLAHLFLALILDFSENEVANAVRTPESSTTALGNIEKSMGERSVLSKDSDGESAVRTLDAPSTTGETQEQKDERRLDALIRDDMSLIRLSGKMDEIWKGYVEEMREVRKSENNIGM